MFIVFDVRSHHTQSESYIKLLFCGCVSVEVNIVGYPNRSGVDYPAWTGVIWSLLLPMLLTANIIPRCPRYDACLQNKYM